MTETKQAIKSAVIGGIIGATAALLLAPKSGKELRGTSETVAPPCRVARSGLSLT